VVSGDLLNFKCHVSKTTDYVDEEPSQKSSDAHEQPIGHL
jgi:hypothetical protein